MTFDLVVLGEPRGGTGGGTRCFVTVVFFFNNGKFEDSFGFDGDDDAAIFVVKGDTFVLMGDMLSGLLKKFLLVLLVLLLAKVELSDVLTVVFCELVMPEL